MESEAGLAAEEIGNGKSTNGEGGRPIDGFRVPYRRWRQRVGPQTKRETARKRHKCRMETENQEIERRKMKDRMGTGIMKTGILEYNMTRMLTDERRYGKLETKEWNDKNFKRRSRETNKLKIGNWTVGVHHTSEISGTKLGK